jgi:nitrate reductase alpha subunit
VPESADWYNSNYIIAWGSNVPQTRTPDAHFFTEVRYKGAKTVAVTPDYSEVAKLADMWLHPKQGTDAALAMAMGHVALKEFYFDKRSSYFDDYARRYTDMPLLVMLQEQQLPDGRKVLAPQRYVRASDFDGQLDQVNNPEWKTVAFDSSGRVVLPNGSIGFRWGAEGRADQGKWNLEAKEAQGDAEVKLKLSVLEDGAQVHEVAEVAFPYFAGAEHPHFPNNKQNGDVNLQRVPATRLQFGGKEVLVATVFDLQVAQYGIDRGLGSGAKSYDDDAAYTPAWQEKITGVPREQLITVARQFADNADKTHGKSMIIIGAAMNHWYHCDMNYRGVINLLDDVRLHRPKRWRLGALRGPGKAAPADRLDRAGVRARLEPPAAPAERHQLLLCPLRPVALREARRRRSALAAGHRGAAPGVRRQHDRPERARRAHGLAAECAAA